MTDREKAEMKALNEVVAEAEAICIKLNTTKMPPQEIIRLAKRVKVLDDSLWACGIHWAHMEMQ